MKAQRQILLVDDEPNVVEGLQRFLRPHRATWKVTTATSARAALAIMEETAFDVVVTDMRMPEMDGASFLTIAKRSSPATMRVVLSGQTDPEAAIRAIPVAHQFLSKPTDPSLLFALIQRLAVTHDAISDPNVWAAIGGIDVLPTTATSYHRLTALLADNSASLAAVAQIIEGEPAIAVKLLQLVNSAFFGVRRQIVAVAEAIAYLGVELVRALVLVVGIANQLPVRAVRFDAGSFHAHSLAVAQMARRISANGEHSSLGFVVALLHDIGQLVMAATMPERFDAIALRAATSGRTFEEEQTEGGGCSHEQIGAALLAMWGVPYAVLETMIGYRGARTATTTALGATDVVYLAHRLVGAPPYALDGDEDRAYLDRLGVSDQLSQWAADAAALRGTTT